MNPWTKALVAAMALVASFMADGASLTAAQGAKTRTWPEVKCERYSQAWAEVRVRYGVEGLGQAFLDSHDAFLASGCTARADVCPRNSREMEIANILTVAAMNAGTASTFLPFACRK